ncbi:hypothetical protein M2650_13685 [Luteimonas sp. SX5]|uniref:Uncharacterized protein n=1 Tax=Luteimonas galliterrae TaxID=2940486 RepID=A0ABT0MLB7_9GAMM|nr:hypothetical protein [Luteimonas galliterrae]MCL1635675.1 hypothetical protein [Luteimonas galliterrae]
MNALRNSRNLPSTPVRTVAGKTSAPVRHVHRERDFGIGYGNSSGYGSAERRYTAGNAPSYFRCR